MIFSILRAAVVSLRRDRFALLLSFLLPIAFFTVFALIYGGGRDTTPRISLILVDEDKSEASGELARALEQENSLHVVRRPADKDGNAQPEYTSASAEAAVRAGAAPVALVIPTGFGQNPIAFGAGQAGKPLELLSDSSDMVAPQMVSGLLQKVAMNSMPESMAEKGMGLTAKYIGGFTPEQSRIEQQNLADLHKARALASGSAGGGRNAGGSGLSGGIVAVKQRAVTGENKPNPMVSFYASAFGVMFLLWTTSGAAGTLLDEADSGTLDRILSSRVTMGTLLLGKLLFSVLLAFSQLAVMFVFGWLVFHVDLPHHVSGFVVMGLSTAFSVAAFGIFLASICRTRAQLGALSTLIVMTMSAIGGSMFPRYFMPPAMQTAGLFTLNGWAIDGFTKVFWRDQPVTALWPQVSVLLGAGIVLFLAARQLARRWEPA